MKVIKIGKSETIGALVLFLDQKPEGQEEFSTPNFVFPLLPRAIVREAINAIEDGNNFEGLEDGMLAEFQQAPDYDELNEAEVALV